MEGVGGEEAGFDAGSESDGAEVVVGGRDGGEVGGEVAPLEEVGDEGGEWYGVVEGHGFDRVSVFRREGFEEGQDGLRVGFHDDEGGGAVEGLACLGVDRSASG